MAMADKTKGEATGMPTLHKIIFGVLLAALIVLPFFVYPVFAMKVMCFALFAAAFNLLLASADCCRSDMPRILGVPAMLRRTRPRSGV